MVKPVTVVGRPKAKKKFCLMEEKEILAKYLERVKKFSHSFSKNTI